MYSAGFYPFKSLEEYWAYWSRHILLNRYDAEVGKPYRDLLKLVENKNYFVITTNVDHMFQKSGFNKDRLFCTQGDYGLWQCSIPCKMETFNNEERVRLMVKEQKNMKIPKELIPYCPYCNAPLTMNLRVDDKFVEDGKWQEASKRYLKFREDNINSKIVYLEIGVGYNTPGIIKYPFRIMTAKNPNSVYATLNMDNYFTPKEIKNRTISIEEDIGKVLEDLNNI
jgi:NAD-dependent SIR2 family protein deacetylase